VGEVAACLEAEHKIVGRQGIPPFESGFFRQTIENIVHFDRLKALGVMREPVALRQTLRINATTPIGILPP
jgi:hypothetical protein